MEKVLVSACLLGINCRYDGKSCSSKEILSLLSQYDLVPFCPEVFGGLPTPRSKSGIKDKATGRPAAGRDVWEGSAAVVSETGEDVTDLFRRGAEECLRTVKALGITRAFLKAGSPSCGVDSVSFFGRSIPGAGVCAELLKRNRIEVFEKS